MPEDSHLLRQTGRHQINKETTTSAGTHGNLLLSAVFLKKIEEFQFFTIFPFVHKPFLSRTSYRYKPRASCSVFNEIEFVKI